MKSRVKSLEKQGLRPEKYDYERKRMMKKQNTFITLIMILGMMTAILSGCGNSKQETSDPEQTQEVNKEQTAESETSEIESNDEEAGSDESEETSMTDLYDYFEANIDHVATDFQELQYDDSYKNRDITTDISGPTDTMETMADGLALAGPFFTVDKEGTVIGISYGGGMYSVCGITTGMPMSEAAEIAKSHGFTFSRVEIAHGTAKYIAVYDNAGMELYISSDADGDFGKTEESDVTGNVESILLTTM